MDQVTEQAQRLATGQFAPGSSGNPSGRPSKLSKQQRIEQKARELSVELGGFDQMTAIEKTFLLQAATLALRWPLSHEDMVRQANSIRSLLTAVAHRRAAVRPPEPTFAERIAAKHGAPVK
jgi:hypothetical protein